MRVSISEIRDSELLHRFIQNFFPVIVLFKIAKHEQSHLLFKPKKKKEAIHQPK